MDSIVLWFLDRPVGFKVFTNVGEAYKYENNVYPTVNKQMPKWLTDNGWPCEYAEDYFPRPVGGKIKKVQCKGLRFANEEALTSFILRWGG